jgi:hypothetical protein
MTLTTFGDTNAKGGVLTWCAAHQSGRDCAPGVNSDHTMECNGRGANLVCCPQVGRDCAPEVNSDHTMECNGRSTNLVCCSQVRQVQPGTRGSVSNRKRVSNILILMSSWPPVASGWLHLASRSSACPEAVTWRHKARAACIQRCTP